jgi:peptidyl-prolyl cis-trans isomerase B (cyclophilin B)
VATNQMRREAAKRKLERQQQRRIEQAKRRQRVAIITAIGVVIVVLALIFVVTNLPKSAETPPAQEPAPTSAPAAALGDCTFTATPGEPAAKPAPVPTVTKANTSGTVNVTLQTNRGAIPVTLDRAKAPCTVESFLSLTKAGFYTGSPCHRLTTGDYLSVLQCGDPTGTGTGGPGYTVNDEKPSDLLPSEKSPGTVTYSRGLLAMANTGQPNSGGSQFFLVYKDSTLKPDYTVFGSISEEGLGVLDKIAADGLADGAQGDGKPRQPVTIQNVIAP